MVALVRFAFVFIFLLLFPQSPVGPRMVLKDKNSGMRAVIALGLFCFCLFSFQILFLVVFAFFSPPVISFYAVHYFRLYQFSCFFQGFSEDEVIKIVNSGGFIHVISLILLLCFAIFVVCLVFN